MKTAIFPVDDLLMCDLFVSALGFDSTWRGAEEVAGHLG